MTAPVFLPAEREAIDATFGEAEAALVSCGLWPGGRDFIHLAHHRLVAGRSRGRRGRKPSHRTVAAAALDWSRAAGDPGLYAAMAIAAAVEARFGPEGLDAATGAWPPLAAARDARLPFKEAVRGLSRVNPEAGAANSGA